MSDDESTEMDVSFLSVHTVDLSEVDIDASDDEFVSQLKRNAGRGRPQMLEDQIEYYRKKAREVKNDE